MIIIFIKCNCGKNKTKTPTQLSALWKPQGRPQPQMLEGDMKQQALLRLQRTSLVGAHWLQSRQEVWVLPASPIT